MKIRTFVTALVVAGSLSACSGDGQSEPKAEVLAPSIALIEAETPNETTLAAGDTSFSLLSPTGRKLIELRDGFCFYSLANDLVATKEKCAPLAQSKMREGSDYSWNPSETRVLSGKNLGLSRGVDTDISYIDVARGEEIVLTEDAVAGRIENGTTANIDMSPVWTSDDRIAFLRFANRATSIMSMSVSDDTPKKLLDVPRTTYLLVSSPDGKRLAFMERRDAGDHHVWVVDAAGGISTELKSLAGRDWPTLQFSADAGRLLACYNGEYSTFTCRVIDVSADTSSDIAGGLQLFGATWSPAGELVAYVVAPQQQATSGIYVDDIASGRSKLIVSNPEGAFFDAAIAGGQITWATDLLAVRKGRHLTLIRLKSAPG